MDHNEAMRKFEYLMGREADHAQETAIELEALVSLLPRENARQIARLEVTACHARAKEFRERAQRAKES